MKRNKSFTDNEKLLYLIATPIGNLEEFSPRAIKIVSDCDIVAAEDTRNSKQLLANFSIHKEMLSLREHNEKEASSYLINQIKNGKKVVYMSDAGYPCISDPGYILVKECLANDVNVSCVSGSSAFINALVSSGLDTTHFIYYGFLPIKQNEALEALNALKPYENTLIFYESPHRIIDTLKTILSVLGDRKAVIGRELTKLNEEFIRGNLNELINIDSTSLKGEMVIIVEGNTATEEIDLTVLKEQYDYLIDKNISNKDAVDILSHLLNIKKNVIKDLTIKKN